MTRVRCGAEIGLSGLNETEDRAPTFRRRYLDQNRNTVRFSPLSSSRFSRSCSPHSLPILTSSNSLPPPLSLTGPGCLNTQYAYHTGLGGGGGGKQSFDTSTGLELTRRLGTTAKLYNLTDVFGHAPRDYYLYRYPHTSSHSVLNLMTSEVLPRMVRRPGRSEPYVVLNTGSIRFDIFKGPFTRNDQVRPRRPRPLACVFVPALPPEQAYRGE